MTEKTDRIMEHYASMGESAYEDGGGDLHMETNGKWFSVCWPDRDGSGMMINGTDRLLAFMSGIRRAAASEAAMTHGAGQ